MVENERKGRAEIIALRTEIERLQIDAAEMRKALSCWKRLAYFMEPPKDYRTGSPLSELLQVCIRATEEALATPAGQPILERLMAAEAVMDAATTHLRSNLSAPTADDLDAAVAAYGHSVYSHRCWGMKA